MTNYNCNIDLDFIYTDKKYKNSDDYITTILNETLYIKDIVNIVSTYLITSDIPLYSLCSLCKGKGNKNVIIHYVQMENYKYYDNTNMYEHLYHTDESSFCNIEDEFDICITCLTTKIPNCVPDFFPFMNDSVEKILCICDEVFDIKDMYEHYEMYEHIRYMNKFNLFKKYYEDNEGKYMKIFGYIENYVEYGVVEISNKDINFFYNDMDDNSLDKYLYNSINNKNMCIDEDIPIYRFYVV